MIQILELIKLLGLGIASAILFITIAMSDITKTKDFMKIVDEVKLEYPEGSLERKIPTSFITTVAAVETGNFEFKGADTANKAKIILEYMQLVIKSFYQHQVVLNLGHLKMTKVALELL